MVRITRQRTSVTRQSSRQRNNRRLTPREIQSLQAQDRERYERELSEYNKSVETKRIIDKYGIDIREYQKNPNYNVNVLNGVVQSITTKPKTYVSEYERWKRKRGNDYKREEKSTYQPEKIIFKNGKAVAKEYYDIETVKSYYKDGGRKRETEYAPKLKKVEYFGNSGQVTKVDEYDTYRSKKKKKSSSSTSYYDTYLKSSTDYVAGQKQSFSRPKTKKSSYLDKVEVVRTIGGKKYTVSVFPKSLESGERYVTSEGVVAYAPKKESLTKPVSKVGLSSKEKVVRKLLIETGQDASDLATIKAIAKSPTVFRSLQDKATGKRDLAEELKSRLQTREIIKSNIEQKINWNNWTKSLSKREAISLLSNYANLDDPKYPGLKRKLTTSSPIETKEALKMAREGWVNPNAMISLSAQAKKDQIYNKYFKKENVSYWNPKTKQFIIVQVTKDFDIKTITGIKGSGKTVIRLASQTPLITFEGSTLAKRIEREIATSRLADNIYNSVKQFGKLNKSSQFDTLTPFSSQSKIRTVSYNKKNKTYTTTEINPKTGKTLKKKSTKLTQAWNRLNNLQIYLIKKTYQSARNLELILENSIENTINLYNYAVTKDAEEKFKKIAQDLDKKGLRKQAEIYYKKSLNSRIISFDIDSELKKSKKKGKKILEGSTILAKTIKTFIEKFLKGGIKVGASLSYMAKGVTETIKLVKKREKLDKKLKKLSKKGKIDKISISKGKFTNETTKLAEEIVKLTNEYTKLLNQYTKTYNLAKKSYYSDDAKLFKEVVKWATIFKFLGGISQLSNISKTIGQVRVPLPQRQLAVGSIAIRGTGVSAKLGMYGIEAKFAQDQYKDFVKNPSPGRLALALFYASSILVSSIRSVKKFSRKYIPTIREVDTTLKLYKTGHIPVLKKFIKQYKKELTILNKKPKLNSKSIKLLSKDITKATKDLKYLEKQVELFEQIIKDPLKLQSGLLNQVAPVKKWMKELWEKANKKVPTQLVHVSPEKYTKLLKQSFKTDARKLLNFENVQAKRIYDTIMKKAGGKITPKQPKNIIAKNELEKIALPIFKKKKVVIGGGRALNSQVSWFRKRKTPDLDAKIIRGAKTTLEEIAKKANKIHGGQKYKVFSGGHKGTYKIVNMETKQTLIELTNSQNFFKIFKTEKVGKWIINKQGLLIESIPSLLKGKASALSKIDRLYRKASKDVGDVFRLTKGKVGSKVLNKVLKTQKGEFVVSGIERFVAKFLGKKRRTLSKGAKVPIDPMYWSTRAETYYSKPTLGFLKLKPQEGTMLVYDATSLSKFSPTIQKKWYKFFDKGGSKQSYNKLIGETQKYINRNPNKFFSGYPKSNTLIDEAEILLAKNSILKYNEQRFFTYVDGQKFSVVKVGFKTPKKMSIVDIFKETLPKYKGRELLFRLDDVNYQRSVLSLKDYVKRTKSPKGLKVFNSLKSKVKKLTGKNLLDIFKKKPTKKISTKTKRTKLTKKPKKPTKLQEKVKDIENYRKKLAKEYDKALRNVKTKRRVLIPTAIRSTLKIRRKYYTKQDITRLRNELNRTIRKINLRRPKTRQVREVRLERKPRTTRKTRTPRTVRITRVPRTPRVPRKPRVPRVPRKPRVPRVPRIPRVPKPPEKPPKIPLPLLEKQLKKHNKIDVYVKLRGAKSKFSRINSGYLTYRESIKLGRFIADNTRIASFDRRKSKLSKRLPFSISTLAKKFRNPKKGSKLPKTARVEKRKYRNDTLGEKRDLKVARLRKAKNQKSIVRIVKGKNKKTTKRRKTTKKKTTKKRTVKRRKTLKKRKK